MLKIKVLGVQNVKEIKVILHNINGITERVS